jgi:hypothetical protein
MFSFSSWMNIRLNVRDVSSSSCSTSVRSSTLFRVTAPPAHKHKDLLRSTHTRVCTVAIGPHAPHSESLSSDALTFLMYLFASVRMIEDTYFSNILWGPDRPVRSCGSESARGLAAALLQHAATIAVGTVPTAEGGRSILNSHQSAKSTSRLQLVLVLKYTPPRARGGAVAMMRCAAVAAATLVSTASAAGSSKPVLFGFDQVGPPLLHTRSLLNQLLEHATVQISLASPRARTAAAQGTPCIQRDQLALESLSCDVASTAALLKGSFVARSR